jgi:hypothetical protein
VLIWYVIFVFEQNGMGNVVSSDVDAKLKEQEVTYNAMMSVMDDVDLLAELLEDACGRIEEQILEHGYYYVKSTLEAIENIIDIYMDAVEAKKTMSRKDIKDMEKSIRDSFLKIEAFKEAVVRLN